ncbi:MAG: hypothetical protein SFY70_13540 [Bacteroidia bacterium]|nr:hypothetical protein [Bacteroidia bacterium]
MLLRLSWALIVIAAAGLAGCTNPSAGTETATAPLLTTFPATITTEKISLWDTELPQGTTFTLLNLPSGKQLRIVLPEGKTILRPNTGGQPTPVSEVCFACECLGDGNCEVALTRFDGGQLAFLNASCPGDVVGWDCNTPRPVVRD